MSNKYSPDLVVVLTPSGQFGGQELAKAEDIAAFVAKQEFETAPTVTAKTNVNGADASPVWTFLKKASGDESDVRWNFACKLLVGRDGNVVERNGDGAADNEAKIVKLLG